MLASQTTTRPSRPEETGGRRREIPQMIRQIWTLWGRFQAQIRPKLGLFPKVLSRGERVSGLAGGQHWIRTGSGCSDRIMSIVKKLGSDREALFKVHRSTTV